MTGGEGNLVQSRYSFDVFNVLIKLGSDVFGTALDNVVHVSNRLSTVEFETFLGQSTGLIKAEELDYGYDDVKG
jgi:hypothetical protein